jgi:hypothetical protein
VDDGGESDASGGTVDLDSQELGSQEPESQEPDSLLPDHIQLSNAAFAPSGSGDLHNLLAKHNVDIDSCDQAGYTTLMSMIKHKRRDSALVLLKNGAGVLFVNSQGWSAFHLAASTGDIEVLQALVAAARRASPTALAQALVSLLVEKPTAPASRPAAAALLGGLAWRTVAPRVHLCARGRLSLLWSLHRRRARARARHLRGWRRMRSATPSSTSWPQSPSTSPTLRRPEAPLPLPLPLPSPTLRRQPSPLPPPPHRHGRHRRSRSRLRRQLRGRRRRHRRRPLCGALGRSR